MQWCVIDGVHHGAVCSCCSDPLVVYWFDCSRYCQTKDQIIKGEKGWKNEWLRNQWEALVRFILGSINKPDCWPCLWFFIYCTFLIVEIDLSQTSVLSSSVRCFPGLSICIAFLSWQIYSRDWLAVCCNWNFSWKLFSKYFANLNRIRILSFWFREPVLLVNFVSSRIFFSLKCFWFLSFG